MEKTPYMPDDGLVCSALKRLISFSSNAQLATKFFRQWDFLPALQLLLKPSHLLFTETGTAARFEVDVHSQTLIGRR